MLPWTEALSLQPSMSHQAENDNSGNGSQSSPLATLTAALTVSQSLYCGPATINILAGTYNDVDLVITNNDITIQGDAFAIPNGWLSE